MSNYYKKTIDPMLQIVRDDILEVKKILVEISEKTNSKPSMEWTDLIVNNETQYPEKDSYVIFAMRDIETGDIEYICKYHNEPLLAEEIRARNDGYKICAWVQLEEYEGDYGSK